MNILFQVVIWWFWIPVLLYWVGIISPYGCWLHNYICPPFFKSSLPLSLSLQVPLLSAGPLDWSCYFSMCAVHSVMFWPMRNSSFCLLSSTLPWTPSSTPTATRRWAPPSDRSSAASAVRTPVAPRKAPTAQLPPSTTPSWLEFTAMTTPWFRKEMKRRSQHHLLRDEEPPLPKCLGKVWGVWEREEKQTHVLKH